MTDDILINTDRYVYFMDDGTITKVLNYIEESENYIVVEYLMVEDILSGKDTVLNYIVLYNKENSTYELKKRLSNNIFVNKVSDIIHEFSRNVDSPSDLTVIQDLSNKKWIFKLSDAFINQITSQKVSIQAPIVVSVTSRGDPHILYKVLTVKIDDIAKSPNGFSLEFTENCESLKHLSLYTVKKLQSYKYEVINE